MPGGKCIVLCPTCQSEVPDMSTVCDFCGTELHDLKNTLIPGPSPFARKTTVLPPEPPPMAGPSVAPMSVSPRPAFDPNDPLKPLMGRFAGGISSTGTTVESPRLALPKVKGALIERRHPDDPGRVHALREGRNKIGRDAGACDVVISDARASGDHGYLFLKTDGSASYHDISRNGTLVDGRPLHGEVASVAHGGLLQIGQVSLLVLLLPP